MRGFFAMEYDGAAGQGSGSLAFVDGKVAGHDFGGGHYVGEFTENAGGTITGHVMMTFPAGGYLVTGAKVPAGSPPMRIPFSVTSEDMERHRRVQLQTPTGLVGVRLREISPL